MFSLLATDGPARLGRLELPHATFETPMFMPVGTQATVKGLTPDQLTALGARIILGNTYHLALRPGDGRIAELGGLHRFMAWDGAILTDSGGFQVFSLDHMVKIDDEGVSFRSHLDGTEQRFTPESVMEMQRLFGSDIAMVLDQPVGWPASAEQAERALARTMQWAKRSL